MFFVYDFNSALEEFEVIGAYSNKAEADAFAEARKTDRFAPVVAENTIKNVIDAATQARLGPIAKALALSGAAPWPAEVFVLFRSGKPAGVFLTREAVYSAMEHGVGDACVSADVGLWPNDFAELHWTA